MAAVKTAINAKIAYGLAASESRDDMARAGVGWVDFVVSVMGTPIAGEHRRPGELCRTLMDNLLIREI